MIEFKTVSLANQVFEALETSILRGEFKYGELVSEKKLAEKLGVSRTPVREAITRLSQEKLIKETPNGSVIIGIQPDDLHDLLVVKRKIEPLIGRYLLENIDKEGIEKFKDIVEQQEFYSQKGDYEKVLRLDTEFHDLMYQISGRVILENILSQIHHKLLKFRLASLADKNRILESTGEHSMIVKALESGESTRVEEILFMHIDHAYNSIMRGIENGTYDSTENN
ncbi:MAG: GntR family transcriptional regulator [Eubacterium sp.]|nr:GntR family transcriptional regulator [Eubacterium sp.]